MIFTLKKWARKIVGLQKIHKVIIAEADFHPGNKVLDVGCGAGMLLGDIYDKFGTSLEYMGIEPDESVRQRAEADHMDKEIKFKRAFANHLPSVQDYYSHIICMVSFHHFPRETWKECLAELRRVLAQGGKLIIVEFGRPTSLVGYILHFVNPCRRLANNLEFFLKSESESFGLRLVGENEQFGYIHHFIFAKS